MTLERVSAGGHIVIGGNIYARSDLEELKDYLAHAIATYEARMFAGLSILSPHAHPYKFLYPFGLEDEPIFFGREAATEELYDRILRDRLTVLYAKSGAGKTSLLNAGISPRLIRQGRLPLYVRMYEDPVLIIKQVVASSGPWPKLLYELSLHDFLGLICQYLSRQTQELIIMFDQFEEFFLKRNELEARHAFIKALGACNEAQGLPLRFIIAIQKEYYADLLEFEDGPPHLAISRNRYPLSPMNSEEVQAAITKPLAKLSISVTYEPTLLETLVADLALTEMELPLLQIICTRLYETREEGEARITLKSYEALGRVQGVLSQYLEGVLADLGREEILARNVLKEFVRADGMKQLCSYKVLTARVEVQRDELDRVLDRLVNARLLRRDVMVEGITYELAHEYLTKEIVKWINAADQEFKQAEELLQRELINWRVHHELIPRKRLEVLYSYRERFKKMDTEAWGCLIRSALAEDFAVADWTKAAGNIGELVLFQIIKMADKEIRRRGIKALREIGNSWAAESFIAVLKNEDLKDKDFHVRQEASWILGELGDPRAVEPLIIALKDGDPEVCWYAAEALGKLKYPQAANLLIIALKDEDPEVRKRAVEVLRKIGYPAVKPLIIALKDEAPGVRQQASWLLGELDGAEAVEPLIIALKDEAPEMRQKTAEALGKIGDFATDSIFLSGGHLAFRVVDPLLIALKDEALVDPLLIALKDEAPGVRQQAVEALGKLKNSRAVEPLLAALKDEAPEVRWQAVEALGKLGDSRVVEPLLAALKDEASGVRSSAIKVLEELGKLAVEPLLAALKDEAPEVRWRAVMALEKLEDSRVVEPLVAAALASLKDEEPEAIDYPRVPGFEGEEWAGLMSPETLMRKEIVEALRKLGAPVVESLFAALRDEDPEVRQRAVKALKMLGNPYAVNPLSIALKDEVLEVRKEAVEILGKLGGSRVVESLSIALKDESLQVRQKAVEALGRLGAFAMDSLFAERDEDYERRVVEPLSIALKDEAPEVRWRAVEALGKLGNSRAVEPLLATLGDEDPEMRRRAVEALGKLGDPRAVEPLIIVLKDEDFHVRQEAVEALGKLGVPAVEPLSIALKDEDPEMRRRAVEALGKLRASVVVRLFARDEDLERRVVEPLSIALKDEAPEVRWQAVEALGKLEDSRAVELLFATLKDEDPEMRRRTVEALGKRGNLQALSIALKDEDPGVRQEASWILGELDDPEAVEPLIIALKDESPQVRQKAVEALGKLKYWRAVDIASKQAVNPLITALKDEDPEVRRRAVEVLGKLGNPWAIEPFIAALKDEDPEVRRRAAWVLRGIRTPEVVSALENARKEGMGEV